MDNTTEQRFKSYRSAIEFYQMVIRLYTDIFRSVHTLKEAKDLQKSTNFVNKLSETCQKSADLALEIMTSMNLNHD